MRNRLLLRERLGWAKRVAATLVVILGVFSTAPNALAVNEPQMQSTSPRAGGFVRSSDVSQITASFDRDLALPPSSIALFDSSPAAVAGTPALSGPVSDTGGRRSITLYLNGPLGEGLYTVFLHACSTGGGGCSDPSFTFKIDDTPPPAPVVTTPVDGSVESGQPPVARGTAEGGAIVVIYEHDAELLHLYADTSGNWITQLPYPPEDGTVHAISVRAVDQAGNWSAATGVTFRHDCIVRTPNILLPLQNASFATTSVTVTGTAKANTTVKVFEGSTELASTPSDGDEKWSAVVTLAEGPHSVVAFSYDTYETDGPSEARAFTVDLTAPGAPVIVQPAAGASVGTTSVIVAGTAEPNGSVRIRESGVVRATAPVAATGEWSTAVSFGEGPHSITAETVDAAGNAGPQTARAFTVDTIAPGRPAIFTPAQDAFLSSSSVTVTGSAEPDTTVRVLEGQALLGSGPADPSGAWSVTITEPDGAHTIQALAVDAAGNIGERSATRSFVVDTLAPGAPVIVNPSEGATLSSNDFLITGTADGATAVTVTEGTTTIGTALADAHGLWSLVATLPNGSHALVARSSDLAGNVSAPSATRDFTINFTPDTTAPDAPVIDDPAEGSAQQGSLVFSGTAEPGATVRVYEDSTPIGSGTANGDGDWAFGRVLATGTHDVRATATDRAGNVSAASALRTFTVDAERPVVTIDSSSGTVFLPPLMPGGLSGDATDNVGVASIEVEVTNRITGARATVPATTCAGCPGTAVSWTWTPSEPGVYDVRVSAFDLVGNRSAPATVLIFVV